MSHPGHAARARFPDMLHEREQSIALERQREVGEDRSLDRRRQRDERAAHLAKEHERAARRERNAQRFGAGLGGESPTDDGDERRLVGREFASVVKRLRDDGSEAECGERLRQTLEERQLPTDQQNLRHGFLHQRPVVWATAITAWAVTPSISTTFEREVSPARILTDRRGTAKMFARKITSCFVRRTVHRRRRESNFDRVAVHSDHLSSATLAVAHAPKSALGRPLR